MARILAPLDNIKYYRQREAEERAARTASSCTHAQQVHHILAERYADKVWSIEEEDDHAFTASGLWDGGSISPETLYNPCPPRRVPASD